MFYKNELSFICEVFQKSHINALTFTYTELKVAKTKSSILSTLGDVSFLTDAFLNLNSHTVYRLRDSFECNYRIILLPETLTPTLLFIGPYLSETLPEGRIAELGEQNGISPREQRYLSEYYLSLPILDDNSPLLTMFNIFCEKIWRSPTFVIKDITKGFSTPEPPIAKTLLNATPDDTLLNIRAIERRYSFENEMIRAVSLGQAHMENHFVAAFRDAFFEKRAPDPLRNAKNYAIIMNTLLRKAAESGGVHPIYLDRISSEFAAKIENLPSLSENADLMCEMFRTYCRLVRKNSLKTYSTVVKDAILIIDADLSADISPNVIAESLGISLGYLSAVFRKETGQTLTEYLRARRMEYAKHLLSTTNLQIQSVALHCGILDVHYFSKLFKRVYQKTPTEYRLEQKHNEQ